MEAASHLKRADVCFLYDVPPNEAAVGRPKQIPKPKLQRNVIFVRLPDGAQGPDPIVVPPPRQQHVLFVLNKQSQQNQQMTEVPALPLSNPEVFFVNYAAGENPALPSGVHRQSSASQDSGQVVGGGSAGVGIGGGFGGGFGGGSGGSITGGIDGGIGSGNAGVTEGGKHSSPCHYCTPEDVRQN